MGHTDWSRKSSQVYKQDFSSEVFFRHEPDAAGNICSPVATVFQSASFISALEELALQAEVVRARQLLVTQPQTRTTGSQNLDPANLFFDSESRAVQASATAEDDAAQAQGLAVQAAMMRKINALQTTNADPNRAGGGASSVPSHVPPPLPPHLFACPGKNRIEPLHLTLPTNATLALCRSPASRAGRAPARGALRPRGHHALRQRPQ